MRCITGFMFGLLSPFIAAFALWGAGLLYFATLIPASMPLPAGTYDVIIALTGGERRVPEAIKLLKDGKAGHLFISGVGNGFQIADVEHNLEAEWIERISYGKEARSTIGNAKETYDWLEAQPYERLLIVTANYHLPRTIMLFDAILPTYDKEYYAVSPAMFQRDNWLFHANSLYLVMSEYHKWLGTWVHLNIIALD